MDTQQVTEQPVQTPVEQPTKEQPKQLDDFSKRLAILTKKEASTLSLKKQIDEERAAFSKEKEELNSKASFIDKVKSRDWKALDEMGFDLNDYVKYKQGGDKPTMESALEKMRAEIREEFSQKLESEKQAYENAVKEQYKKANDSVLTEFKKEIKSILDRDAQSEKKWELLYSYENPEGEIANYISDHLATKGVRLTPQEAADTLEEFLLNQERAKFEKHNKLKKLAEESLKPKEELKSDPKKPTTLTSSMTTPTPSADRTKWTVEKSLVEAAKGLKWT